MDHRWRLPGGGRRRRYVGGRGPAGAPGDATV